jgi:hypothetical protein
MWRTCPDPDLLLAWHDPATVRRTFSYRLCRRCELGFWQRRRRRGGPRLYCSDDCRQIERRFSKVTYMRKQRTESWIPHYGLKQKIVDGKLVSRRTPGGNQRRTRPAGTLGTLLLATRRATRPTRTRPA